MPTTDPTPLEDALRNLGDELSAAGNPQRAAVHALARHAHTPAADTDLVEAAVDHGLAARHGRDNPYHNATLRLMCRDQLIVGIVNRATAEGNRRAERLLLEVRRQQRINLGALHYAAQIDPHAGPGVIASQLGSLRLLLGDSRTLAGGDPYDAALAAISQQAPGHPEETP